VAIGLCPDMNMGPAESSTATICHALDHDRDGDDDGVISISALPHRVKRAAQLDAGKREIFETQDP
jgi:hypothetical protein